MDGWYAMKRGWLKHDLFKPKGKWSRAEAWVWIVESAAYRPVEIDIGGRPFTVPRGSLVHSRRFMASKWKWSETAVMTFLKQIEEHGALELSVAKTGPSRKQQRIHIRLCNYDKYQHSKTTTEPERKPQQNHNKTKEEQGNKYTPPSGEADAASCVQVSVVTTAVWAVGKQFLASRDVKDPGSIIGRWLKDHQPIAILAAIEQAQKAGTQNPVPYITKILSNGGVSNGGKHDRTQFNNDHREYSRRVGAGQVDFGPDDSDPFAGR